MHRQTSYTNRLTVPDFAVNAAGQGHAKAKRPWPLDESSPRSVIIHADPTNEQGGAGARLACIDLDSEP